MKPKSESVVMEDELEQAEVMLAAQELVDELQKMVEDILKEKRTQNKKESIIMSPTKTYDDLLLVLVHSTIQCRRRRCVRQKYLAAYFASNVQLAKYKDFVHCAEPFFQSLTFS